MPRDVFISHSAQDKKVAETICGALEQQGIRCWVAPRDVRPGKSFPGEITRAIQQSKVMLLIFSRHSNSSEQVLREVQLAVDCRVPIVRLRMEDIPLSDDLRYYLSTPHWLDALTQPLSKHIPPLIVALKELLAGADEPATLAPSRLLEPAAPRLDSPTEEKSSATRRIPAIAWAVVVLAVLGFTMWSRLSKKSEPRPTPIPSPQPTVAAAPSPAVSATPITVAPASPSPVVAPSPTPSPTAPEVTPTPEARPSPTASEPNKKGPLARNNRAWQPWIDEFVHNFIASNETNDVDLAMSFYAANVDLFDEGKKSADAIRRDIETYNARWPSRRATIRGDVRLAEKAANHNYTASFEHDYYVENASRGEWINGAVAVDLQIIVEGGGVPRIVSMKQKTLRKDKGTMQKR
jgi:TIR domain-containing protein